MMRPRPRPCQVTPYKNTDPGGEVLTEHLSGVHTATAQVSTFNAHRHIELLGLEDSILVYECVRFVHHAHRCSRVLVGVFLLVTAIFVQEDLKETRR